MPEAQHFDYAVFVVKAVENLEGTDGQLSDAGEPLLGTAFVRR
jgi:hypothetical protein